MDEIFIYIKTKELCDKLTEYGVTDLKIQFTGVPYSDIRHVSPSTTMYFIYVMGNFKANTFHLTLEFSISSNVKFNIVSTEIFSPGAVLQRTKREYKNKSENWSIFIASLNSVLNLGTSSASGNTERALDQSFRLDIDGLPGQLEQHDVKNLTIQFTSHNRTGYLIFVMGTFQADTFHLTLEMNEWGYVKFLIVSVTQFPLELGEYRQKVFSYSIGAKYGKCSEKMDDFIRNLGSVLQYGIDSKTSIVKTACKNLTDDGFKVVWNGKDESFTAEKHNVCLRIDRDGDFDDVFIIEGKQEFFSKLVETANQSVKESIETIPVFTDPSNPRQFRIFDDNRVENQSIFNTEPIASIFKKQLIREGYVNGVFSISKLEHTWELEVRGNYKEGVSVQFRFYFERESTSHPKSMWYSEIIVNNKAYSTLYDAIQSFETIATQTIEKATSLLKELYQQIKKPEDRSVVLPVSAPPKGSAFHSDTTLSSLLHRLNQFMD